MRLNSLFACVFILICISTKAQIKVDKDIISLYPPMGWNSFDSYGVYLYEDAAFKNLETMAKDFKDYGYEYFVIDNGWFGEYKRQPESIYSSERHASDININEYGLIQPSNCYFPNGFGPLIKRCHELGLKFGIHLMRGIPRKAVELDLPIYGTSYTASDIADTINVCSWCHYNYGVDMTKPGSQEFYNSLINQFADWGVDFIKIDDIVPFPNEVEAIVSAVNKCGREIVLSLSPGDEVSIDHLKILSRAQMLRVTGDVWDNQADIDKCFVAWKRWSGRSIPGFWFDMDMIPFGNLQQMSPKTVNSNEIDNTILYAGRGYARKSELSPAQMRTFITLRSMSASPLMIGGDLPSMDDYSNYLLKNKEMIACNQKGEMGKLIWEKDNIEIWHCGDALVGGWIGIFNRNVESKPVNIPNCIISVLLEKEIKNIWNNAEINITQNKIFMEIEAHDVVFIKY